jgi:hypothetical protein
MPFLNGIKLKLVQFDLIPDAWIRYRLGQDLRRWERERMGPLPHLLKQRVVLKYAALSGARVFVNDAHAFDGTPDYPTVAWIENTARSACYSTSVFQNYSAGRPARVDKAKQNLLFPADSKNKEVGILSSGGVHDDTRQWFIRLDRK